MARYLLDTQVVLWLDSAPDRVPREVCSHINAAAAVYFSAASAWEAALKRAIGKLRSGGRLAEFAANAGFLELPITARHAEASAALPVFHRDPFDRVLVAQAIAEQLTLVTADRQLARYPVAVLQL